MAELNWQSIITDDKERKIFEALEDPKWDWRTVRALSRESGLEAGEVRAIIGKYPELIRKSEVPSQKGEDLYTLQSRFYEGTKGWDFLSSSST
jgi:hypothetical protein